jgi:hypothetical protein
MTDKSVALSARLPAADAQFLTQWRVEGADTPSEKLRRVVRDTRERVRATTDYRQALRMTTELFGPSLEYVREAEVQVGQHSQLMARISEWLPEMTAYLYSAEGLAGPDTESNLKRLEGGVAMRVMALMQSVLQMAVTPDGPFYDPALLNDRLRGTLDTARVVSDARYRASDSAGS